MLLSTHGAMVYHPNPVDFWRWTHAGLERLFRDNGDWASVTVSAGSGTAACLAMLNASTSISSSGERRFAPVARPRGRAAQPRRAGDRPALGAAADERPGTIAANYHVVAERTS